MSAMGAIYQNIWEFIENPDLDDLRDSINGYALEFERYTNKEKRHSVLVSFYKNGAIQRDMSKLFYLDEFYKTYMA